MTILAAVGDIARFPTSKQLVGYAGLGTRIHASGQVQRSGGITKEGRSELRIAMVEAAWVAVEHHPHWKGEFERLSVRIGKPKAIVAIARKLLVAVWHVLSRRCADIHGSRAGRCPLAAQLPRTLWHHSRQTPLSGSALASLPGSVGAWRRSGSNSLQRSPLSPQRCAPGKRKDLRAVLVSFLSGLPESIRLLLPVKTRALRAALLRDAGLDTPQHARFAAVRTDSKAKNMRLFCPLDLLFTSVSE